MAAPAAAAPAAASLPLRLKRAGSFGRSRKTLEVDETGQGGETGTSMKPVVVRRASSWSRLRSDRAQRREVANAARGALSRAQTEVQGPSDAQTEEAATEHAPAALSALEAVDRTQEWLETHGEPAAVSADTPIAYLHDDVSARPSVVLTQALQIFGSMDEEEQEAYAKVRRMYVGLHEFSLHQRTHPHFMRPSWEWLDATPPALLRRVQEFASPQIV